MTPVQRVSTKVVFLRPAATTNMEPIRTVLVLDRPLRAVVMSRQPVTTSSTSAPIAVIHMGILFSR